MCAHDAFLETLPSGNKTNVIQALFILYVPLVNIKIIKRIQPIDMLYITDLC